MVSAILPWPSRRERKAGVEAARVSAEEARQRARHARGLTEELTQLRRRNHVREALDQLIQRRSEEQK